MVILEENLGRKSPSLILKLLELRNLWDIQEEAPNKQPNIGFLNPKEETNQREVLESPNIRHLCMPGPGQECALVHGNGNWVGSSSSLWVGREKKSN